MAFNVFSICCFEPTDQRKSLLCVETILILTVKFSTIIPTYCSFKGSCVCNVKAPVNASCSLHVSHLCPALSSINVLLVFPLMRAKPAEFPHVGRSVKAAQRQRRRAAERRDDTRLLHRRTPPNPAEPRRTPRNPAEPRTPSTSTDGSTAGLFIRDTLEEVYCERGASRGAGGAARDQR